MAKEYKLEIGTPPEKVRFGIYDQIVAEFIEKVVEDKANESTGAKVVLPNKPVKTIQIGLSKAVQNSPQRGNISVSIRNGEVWLVQK